MVSGPLNLFPPNGLDRSLHASVLVGLALMTFFTEALGWSYGGLVVPGYLATVFIAAPLTGALIVFEAILTYLLVRLVGEWVVRTDAWSTTFGRERFFLFLVGGVLVRLTVEGALVPWLVSRYHVAHARELYSIGLVLVPLIANSIWNAGLIRGGPRMAFLTLLTFLIVKHVLIRFTNLSVSSFQINNESVSQAFLDTPKEQIILLVGALLGARNNVQYGWDYNGILVPGLLAVSWFQPTKLATSLAEAIVLYLVMRALVSVRPFSRLLIVGPRRMLLAFAVGFLLKIALGFLLFRIRPDVRMPDYYGFGYLLPTLIAVKIWNKERIGVVLMPTLQVSIVAFVLGSLLGFGMVAIDKRVMAGTREAPRAPVILERGPSVSWALTLFDSAPRFEAPDEPWQERRERAYEVLLDIAKDVEMRGRPSDAGIVRASEARLELRQRSEDGTDWITFGPRIVDPDDDASAPRGALRAGPGTRGRWAVVIEAPGAGSSLMAAGYAAARRLDARAIVVISRHEPLQKRDQRFAEQLFARLDVGQAIVVVAGEVPKLRALATVPPGLDVQGLGRDLNAALEVSWRSVDEKEDYLPSSPRLVLPSSTTDAVAARTLGAPGIERWSGPLRAELARRLVGLTTAGRAGHRPPSIEELRVFRSVVWPAVQRLAGGRPPTEWERAVAHELGYAVALVGDADRAGDYVLFEPEGEERRGHASLVIRPAAPPAGRPGGANPLLVEVPAPRWEVGAFGAGLALSAGLGAEGLLFAGVLPNEEPLGTADVRRPASRRSYYETIHESWLGESEGNAIALDGILPERESRDLVVVSFGRELLPQDALPPWGRSVLEGLTNAGLTTAMYDGSSAFASLRAAPDMGMAFAERFAPDRMATLWLSSPLRARFLLVENNRLAERLQRTKLAITDGDVAKRARDLANGCVWAEASGRPRGECPFSRQETARCDVEAFSASFDRYALTANPLELRSMVHAPSGCYLEIARDGDGIHFALAARPGHVRVLPLEVRGRPLRVTRAVTSLEAVRSAVDVGVAAIDVEATP